jgi:hypothetical protein
LIVRIAEGQILALVWGNGHRGAYLRRRTTPTPS